MVGNPFISVDETSGAQYLTENCSLNRVALKKLPAEGIEDGLAGLTADKIFSTPVLIEEIIKNSKALDINVDSVPRTRLPFLLEERLVSGKAENAAAARKLVKKFGYRLGMIFLALKKGEPENRASRPDWTDAHWEYWAQIKTVILVGGLTNGLLGARFKEYALELFQAAGIEPYDFVLFENASFVGIMGCASKISKPEGLSVVFDFGQTSVKRCIVRKSGGEIAGITTLPSIESKYMKSSFEEPQEQRETAVALHKYLMNLILSTYREAEKDGELSDEIIVSIASYTVGGRLNDKRGGYAKLTLLCGNYADCLSEELSGRLKRRVRVTLVHDGTAVALYFSGYKDAVCITMGTGFGVGFPDISI